MVQVCQDSSNIAPFISEATRKRIVPNPHAESTDYSQWTTVQLVQCLGTVAEQLGNRAKQAELAQHEIQLLNDQLQAQLLELQNQYAAECVLHGQARNSLKKATDQLAEVRSKVSDILADTSEASSQRSLEDTIAFIGTAFQKLQKEKQDLEQQLKEHKEKAADRTGNLMAGIKERKEGWLVGWKEGD